MERWTVAVAVMGIALAGCNDSGKATQAGEIERPNGPQTYTVAMGAPSPEGQNIDYAAFFPARVRVRPGDTVIFENRSSQAPHTATFGSDLANPGALSPVTKAGSANPVVFGPCFDAVAPAAGAESCPSAPQASPPPFTGKGFWHSGALAPTVDGEPARFALTVAPGTESRTYSFRCVLHPNMGTVLEVVKKDEFRVMPADSDRRAERERASVVAAAAKLAEPAAPEGVTVVAGWGDQASAVNRFAPSKVTVKAGQAVTWKTMSPVEPHTVTFASPFKTPGDPGVMVPAGVAAGGAYAGGVAHSGLVGPKPHPAESFSLVFTKPGLYSYVCALHPGMTGQVEVTK